MFEPLKLISVALALLLLIPFGCLFWRLAAHPIASESELRVHAERALEDHKKRLGTTNADGGWYVGGGVRIVERIGFSAQTESWLSFYPRRWVGWLGFTAIAVILFCVVLSLFFPPSPCQRGDLARYDAEDRTSLIIAAVPSPRASRKLARIDADVPDRRQN